MDKISSNLLSVIVPVYNVEQYLHKAINSVLEQTFSNFELLLINDGSTDNSLNICKEFALKDSRIKVFDQNNQGVSAARNKGISEALGDWLLFLDSDDYIYESSCLSTIFQLEDLAQYDIIIGNLVYVYSSHQSVFKQTVPNEISFKEISKLLLTDKVAPALHGKLYRKSLFENLSFDRTHKIGEDFIMNVQILSKTDKIHFIDYPIYAYNQRDNSVMHKPSQKAIESIPPFVMSVYDFYNKYPQQLSIEKELNQFILSRFYLYFLYGGKYNNQKEFKNLAKTSLFQNKNVIPAIRFFTLKLILFNHLLGSCIRKPLLLVQSKQK